MSVHRRGACCSLEDLRQIVVRRDRERLGEPARGQHGVEQSPVRKPQIDEVSAVVVLGLLAEEDPNAKPGLEHPLGELGRLGPEALSRLMGLCGVDADQPAAPELLELDGVSVDGSLHRRRPSGVWRLRVAERLALEALVLAAIRVAGAAVDAEKPTMTNKVAAASDGT